MRQLGLSGEIDWTTTHRQPDRLDFRVSRPGRMFHIRADLRENVATVERTDLNLGGVIHVLHTFTGVRAANPASQRDWILTTVWSLAMDAVAGGLILMVFSSYYMWHRYKKVRLPGWAALGAGCLSCGFFVVDLAWLVR